MGEIKLKQMRLIFQIYNVQDNNECVRFVRKVTDLLGNVIWEDDGKIHYTTATESFFNALELQMKQLPVWNITQTMREYL